MGYIHLLIPTNQKSHQPTKITGIKIAFICNNTLAHLIKTTTKTKNPPHNRPGIYQLKCHTSNHSYVGQTSRNLKTRYNEHIRYIKSNNPQSAYAQHILNNTHEYGTIDSLMTLLKPIHNQHLLTTYEQFYIHSFQNTAISSPNNPLAAQTHSLTWPSTRLNPAPTKLVVLRTSQWIHNQPTGSDCLHSHKYVN